MHRVLARDGAARRGRRVHAVAPVRTVQRDRRDGVGIFFVLLGYVLGESWHVAERWIGRGGLVVGTLALIGAVWWLRRHRCR